MSEVQDGINAGITLTLHALIATHPNHQQFQLFLAALMDKQVMERTFAGRLNPAQMAAAIQFVEQLQRVEAVQREIDPLSMAGLSIKSDGWRG